MNMQLSGSLKKSIKTRENNFVLVQDRNRNGELLTQASVAANPSISNREIEAQVNVSKSTA